MISDKRHYIFRSYDNTGWLLVGVGGQEGNQSKANAAAGMVVDAGG